MTSQSLPWMQQLNHFTKALAKLAKFVNQPCLNELEKQGLIHAFVCAYELAWNTLGEFIRSQGVMSQKTSRETFRLAYKRGLIVDSEAWMDMIRSRALAHHAYHDDTADKIAADVTRRYYLEFIALQNKLESLRLEHLRNLVLA